MDEIGYEDYFYGNGVCLIEWADLIRELLPEETGRITIEKDLEKDLITGKFRSTELKDGRHKNGKSL